MAESHMIGSSTEVLARAAVTLIAAQLGCGATSSKRGQSQMSD
jgi:hypothetical protein